MKLIFTPKHQKLVNNCYPRGRTSDMKPKSSESAYLIYYVNSRRSKLEKVSKYLARRSVSDLRHRKVGHVAVTIIIMNNIIAKCNENLNIYIKEFVYIMVKILSDTNFNNDITIIELLEESIKIICSTMDTDIFYGNNDFTNIFISFIELFFKVVQSILHNDDLLLKGCTDVATGVYIASNVKTSYLVSLSVNHCLRILQDRFECFRYPNVASSIEDGTELTSIKKPPISLLTSMTELHSEELSVVSARSFFHSTETNKLTLSIRELLILLHKVPNTYLLLNVCDTIPVQLRYITVIVLLRYLNNFKKFGIDPMITMKLISALFLSNISIIGLSVLDIMRKILTFQLNNIANIYLTVQCRTTIVDISNKFYYPSQTSDVINELLNRLEAGSSLREIDCVRANIISLISRQPSQAISLNLSIRLMNYLPEKFIELINIAEKENLSSVINYYPFCKLIKFISSIPSKERAVEYLKVSFQYFGTSFLYAGIQFLDVNTDDRKHLYYTFHEIGAGYTNSELYAEEIQSKKEIEAYLKKDEIFKILSLPQQSMDCVMRSADRYSFGTENSSEYNGLPAPFKSRSSDLRYQKDKNMINYVNGPSKFDSFQKYATVNMISIKSTSSITPSIKDLKIIYGNRFSTKKMISEGRPLSCAQSLKSKATNISFLLNELKGWHSQDMLYYDEIDRELLSSNIDISSHIRSFTKMSDNTNFMSSFGSKFPCFQVKNVLDNELFCDVSEYSEVPLSRGRLFNT